MPDARRRGFVLGLTGGVASGKSTVARMLARRGAFLVEADEIGHALLRPGQPAARAVIRAFGPKVAAPGGGVDRKSLGAIVFADPRARRRLDRLVHPPLLREFARRVARARRSHRVVVASAALLVEWNWLGPLDALVVVDAPRALQIVRLRAVGHTRREALQRIRTQLDRRRKRAPADRVIVNDGSTARLRAQVDALWRAIEDRSLRRGARDVSMRRRTRPRTPLRCRGLPRSRP